MFQDLLKNAKIVKMNNGAAAGTSLVTSSTIDAAGYNSALVICDLAAVVDGSVMSLQVQDGAASNGSDAANITGASAGLTGATSSNGQIVVNVHKPLLRYLTATFARTTQNATVNSITAFLYNANGPEPVTQPTTVLASADVAAGS